MDEENLHLTDGRECWCHPIIIVVTGGEVIVHNRASSLMCPVCRMPGGVMFNLFNQVIQCHRCGHVVYWPEASAEDVQ